MDEKVSDYIDCKNVIKIPPHILFHHHHCKYYAHLHTFAKTSKLLSIIYSILIVSQLILSIILFPLAINDSKDSFSIIFQLISPILCGGGFFGRSTTVITSFAFSIIDIVILLIIFWRVYVYTKNKVISRFEESSILILSEYFIPLSLPQISSCLPFIVSTFIEGNLNIFYLIVFFLCIITIVVSLVMQYFYFCPSIQFSEDFLHEWDSSISTITTLLVIFSDIALITVKYSGKTVQIIVVVLETIAYGAYSFYAFITKPYVNIFAMKIVCVVTPTLTLTSIFNLIGLFVPINLLFNIILTIIVFVIIYALNGIVNNKIIQKYIAIIDDFEKDPSTVDQKQLATAIKITMDLYLSPVYTMSNYEKIFKDQEIDNDLLIIYARIIASFPRYKSNLNLIYKRIKCSTIRTRKSLEMQLLMIIENRSTTLNSEVFSYFNDFSKYEKSIRMATLKFWENVSVGNTNAFWTTSESISRQVKPMVADVNQLLLVYDNIPEVLVKAMKIHFNITFKFDQILKINDLLGNIRKNIPSHPDRALSMFLKVYPGVAKSFPELAEDVTVSRIVEDVDIEEIKQKMTLYDIIKSSSAGSVTFILIFLIFGYFMVTLWAWVLNHFFQKNVISSISNTIDVFDSVNSLLLNIARYGLLLSEYQALNDPTSPMKNDDAAMRGITPNWFGKHDDIPRFVVTYEDVLNVSGEIRNDLESLSNGLAKLNSSKPCVSTFLNKYNSDRVEGLNASLEVSIARLIMLDKVDEKFVDDIFAIYNTLKGNLIEFAETNNYNDEFSNTNLYMFILIASNVLFVAMPVICQLLYVITQMDEIAEAFSALPANEIKKALNVNEKCALTDSNYSSMLEIIRNIDLSYLIFSSFVFSLAPVVFGSIIYFFYGYYYVDYSNQYSKSAAYTKLGTASSRMTYIAMIQVFEESYEGTNPNGLDKPIVKKSMSMVKRMLEVTQLDVIKSTLMMHNEYHAWLKVEDNYRTTYWPLDENLTKMPAAGVDFERLAAQKWRDALDNYVFIMGITAPGEFLSLKNYAFGTYFGWWMYKEREVPFYSLIKKEFDKNSKPANILLFDIILMFVLIAFSYVYVVFTFNSLRTRIMNAFESLLLLETNTVLNCPPVMSVLLKGRYTNEASDAFRRDNTFLQYIEDSVCKVDSNFNVIEKNPEFQRLMDDIENIQDFEINPEENVNSLNILLGGIKQAFSCVTPHFTQKISVVHNGSILYFDVEVIAATETRIAYENDDSKVTFCILMFKDKTEAINAENIIKSKRSELDLMLKNVLPASIVPELQSGKESLSFNVHSITMGEIRVRASKRFSFTSKEPHNFYNTVYKEFDKIIAKYPLLSKIRTFAHNYTFAGGLFMDVNKQERHSEEVIKFLFEVIQNIPNISKLCGTEVSLLICVHTGGPVIAGVLSLDMPSFIVLGNVHKYLHELKIFSETNVIHITRSVYELIFSSGFHITETDEIKVGNENVSTYIVYP